MKTDTTATGGSDMRKYASDDRAAQHRAMGDRVYSMGGNPFAHKRTGRPASPRTLGYLGDLQSELTAMRVEIMTLQGCSAADAEQFSTAAADTFAEVAKTLTQDEASAAIDRTKAAKAEARTKLAELRKASAGNAPAAAELTTGFYIFNDQAVEIRRSQSSGRLYAMVLVTDVTDEGAGKWEYAKGLQYKIRPEHRMTLETAKAFGQLTHHCGCCGARLTNPESIERGIGPVCASKL